MTGDWISRQDDSFTIESWSRISPSTLEGTGRTEKIDEPQTISSESLRIVIMSGIVFYIAKVAHNELPVAFRLTEASSDTLIFENPAHDFPTRISYTFTNKDRLSVRVSAGDRGFVLEFTRMKAE
ncbi:hypothetical protein JW823_10405 [bacterium]|nr:hypothetical protein [candidate division CSSED10-310 bacterium]